MSHSSGHHLSHNPPNQLPAKNEGAPAKPSNEPPSQELIDDMVDRTFVHPWPKSEEAQLAEAYSQKLIIEQARAEGRKEAENKMNVVLDSIRKSIEALRDKSQKQAAELTPRHVVKMTPPEPLVLIDQHYVILIDLADALTPQSGASIAMRLRRSRNTVRKRTVELEKAFLIEMKKGGERELGWVIMPLGKQMVEALTDEQRNRLKA